MRPIWICTKQISVLRHFTNRNNLTIRWWRCFPCKNLHTCHSDLSFVRARSQTRNAFGNIATVNKTNVPSSRQPPCSIYRCAKWSHTRYFVVRGSTQYYRLMAKRWMKFGGPGNSSLLSKRNLFEEDEAVRWRIGSLYALMHGARNQQIIVATQLIDWTSRFCFVLPVYSSH